MIVPGDPEGAVSIGFDDYTIMWVYGALYSYPIYFFIISGEGEGKAMFRSLEPVTGLVTEGNTFKALLHAPNQKYDGKELTFEIMEKQLFRKDGICYTSVPRAAVGRENSQSL